MRVLPNTVGRCIGVWRNGSEEETGSSMIATGSRNKKRPTKSSTKNDRGRVLG